MANRQLRCPSCDGPMNRVERRGVWIDVCADCRGVFLDRGELDQMLERAPEWERDDEREDYERPARGHDKRRRRKSFLSDIFEFGE
jgi:Zn-finger nucleic acid-binding protein